MQKKIKHLNNKFLLILISFVFVFTFSCDIDGIGPIAPVPTPTPIDVTPIPSPSTSPDPNKSDWFEVFFSQVHSGDVTASSNNPENIDKKLISKLNNASKSIYAAIFELDSETIANAFISAKNRGVSVKIVTDTDYINEDEIINVKNSGIQVVDDNRSALMHNKFIIIDGEYVWTGSFNTTDNGANKNNNNSIFIKSKELAENYTDEFNEMFLNKQFGITSPSLIKNPLITIDNTEIISLFSPENNVDSSIINEINNAKEKIYFLAFSFTHDEIGQTMINKSKDGIDVKGVFESRGANTTYSEYPKMLSEGLDVYLDANSYSLHHKVIIIDDKTVLSGSFNFSENATQTNDENLIIIRNNTQLATAFVNEFNSIYTLAKGESTDSNNTSSPKININTASKEELDTLPGIGETLAQRIIDSRPYSKIEDIKNVDGIGDSTFENIKDLISI